VPGNREPDDDPLFFSYQISDRVPKHCAHGVPNFVANASDLQPDASAVCRAHFQSHEIADRISHGVTDDESDPGSHDPGAH
jgi:hypothetical protein